ncbi:MAG: HAD family hydrolase [Saprospiraceae bacterium]
MIFRSSKKKYLVFDLDNTLIVRDQAMIDCIENIFKKKLSNSQKVVIKKQDEEGHSDRIVFCQWLKVFLKIQINKNEIWDLIKNNIGFFVSLNDGARPMLQDLHGKYELVLLTNGGKENQQRKIDHTGLKEFFPEERIFISGQIGYSKPNPRIFQLVENKFGKNNHYCMIGNHFEKDIIGAKEIGWQAIYLSQEKKYSSIENVICISSLSKMNKALYELKY